MLRKKLLIILSLSSSILAVPDQKSRYLSEASKQRLKLILGSCAAGVGSNFGKTYNASYVGLGIIAREGYVTRGYVGLLDGLVPSVICHQITLRLQEHFKELARQQR